MRHQYDAANPDATFPEEPQVIAGYIDGNYRSFERLAGRFPRALHVPIATQPGTNDGLCGDFESGNGELVQWVQWVARRRDAGLEHPWLYFSVSRTDEVKAGFRDQGVALPLLWGASWNGIEALIPGFIAHQYASFDAYDVSVLADYVPGLDTPPNPAPTRRLSDMYLMNTAVGDHPYTGNEATKRGYRIDPTAQIVATRVSVDGGLASKYAWYAAAGFPHFDDVPPLVIVGEVEEILRRYGRPTDQASVAAAIEP